MHSLVRLAKQTVEAYIGEGKVFQPQKLTLTMKEKAGVFVSIHKHGELRGCIGTIEPQRGNVAEEIILNAISSATRDPRFYPKIYQVAKCIGFYLTISIERSNIRNEYTVEFHASSSFTIVT